MQDLTYLASLQEGSSPTGIGPTVPESKKHWSWATQLMPLKPGKKKRSRVVERKGVSEISFTLRHRKMKSIPTGETSTRSWCSSIQELIDSLAYRRFMAHALAKIPVRTD